MCLYKARKGTVNWSDLCNDILGLIMLKLSTIEDILHFGAVCRQWRSFSVENRHLSNRSIVVPWLMLADPEDGDSREFYSLSTQKIYNLNLPEACSRWCWSSQGWLITVGLDWDFQLLNVVSRVIIRLPSQPTFIDDFQADIKFTPKDQVSRDRIAIKKIVLSSTPSPSVETTTPSCEEEDVDDEKCVVMVLSSDFGNLSFLRLGDEVWRAIDSTATWITDVIYFNDKFYAIDHRGTLYICDISSLEPKTILFAEVEGVFANIEYGFDFYLVESVGELLMVSRSSAYTENGERSTVDFDVYKFNFDNRKWTKLKSLDNRALFVGNNSSFAIFSPNHHPRCELNCIYFSDVEPLEDEDQGVFRMETQEIESLGFDFFSFCTPLWIGPSL